MIDIVNRLRFDAVRCEAQFSKGVAGNIVEAADEIERLRALAQRAPDGDRPYCPPIEQGKAFYLAMYEHEGANWDANENQDVWVKLARDYERRRRAALSSTISHPPENIEPGAL